MSDQENNLEAGSILNVFGFKPNDPLDDFAEIWYHVFLWALFSSMFVHIIAAAVAFCQLRKHKRGRWVLLVIIVTMGVLSPLTGGICTSAAIAGIYTGSDFEMPPFYALCWGVAQTVVLVVVSFSRILSTL